MLKLHLKCAKESKPKFPLITITDHQEQYHGLQNILSLSQKALYLQKRKS